VLIGVLMMRLGVLWWSGWCSAGADHYEPIMAYSASHLPQETAAFVL